MVWWLPRLRGGGNGELLIIGYRVLVLQGDKVLEIDYTTMRMYLTTLNCADKSN